MNTKIDICQDVLDHLELLNVKQDHYVLQMDKSCSIKYENEQVQDYVDELEKNCYVCAQGALFLSFVRLFNNVTTQELIKYKYPSVLNLGRKLIFNKLLHHFGEKELRLIEIAFECGDVYNYKSSCHVNFETLVDRAIEFGLKYEDHKERLKAIILNIIENGEFRP